MKKKKRNKNKNKQRKRKKETSKTKKKKTIMLMVKKKRLLFSQRLSGRLFSPCVGGGTLSKLNYIFEFCECSLEGAVGFWVAPRVLWR